MADRREQLDQQIRRQGGIASVTQLDGAGVTDWYRRRGRATGDLEKIGAHTYRSRWSPVSRRDQLAALVFDCGPEARACGPSAAALHGFDGFTLRQPFHVVVPRGRNVQRAGHHVHTTHDVELIDRAVVDGIPVLSPARTVIDLARTCSIAQITRAIDSVIRDGGASEQLLHRRTVALRGQGRHGAPKVIAALEGADAARGGHSWLERRYLELLAGAGLPRPSVQVVLSKAGDRLIRVDCHWPGTPLVVELLGYRWHRTQAQMTADARRLNALALDGRRVVQFTYQQVTEAEQEVVGTTSMSLATYRAA